MGWLRRGVRFSGYPETGDCRNDRMTATHYEGELTKLGTTYDRALRADIQHVKTAIAGASDASIIGVGSGGSFTAASPLCNLARNVYWKGLAALNSP
jgi:hypothetical protein